MAPQQQDHEDAIQGFRKWVDENSVCGTLGDTERPNTKFMIGLRLENWLKEGTHTQDLLRILWPDDAAPLQPQDIYWKCSKAFAILLLIGMGRYINHFIQHESLWDDHMPFDKERAPADFPTTDVCPKFYQKFVERQWQFCAHHFRYGVDIHLAPERILPIKTKTLIGTGGFADLYKITIYPGYDELTGPLDQGRDANDGFTNTYVLKTYRTPDAQSHYRNEVNAFKRLRSQSDCLGKVVIGFHGSFTQDGTFNTLIEYASGGTLEEFIRRNDPPADGDEIYKLWQGVFELTKAVQAIHSLSHDESGPPILQGWHQDIKPSNILVTTSKTECPFDVQFKLADLGLAHFRRITSKNRSESDSDTQGTRIYGAPECYRFDDFDQVQRLDVKQSVDIWSLGCVYSEIAVWLVLGKDALLRYRRNRREETAEMFDFKDHGCFHNGENVLKCVENIHNKVFDAIRMNDHITKAVIKKMIAEMLDHFDGRPNARQLRRKAQTILNDAKQVEEKRNGGGETEPSGSKHETYRVKAEPGKMPPKLPPDRDVHGRAGRLVMQSDARASGKKSKTLNSYDQSRPSPATSLCESPERQANILTAVTQDSPELESPVYRPKSAPDPAVPNREVVSQVSHAPVAIASSPQNDTQSKAKVVASDLANAQSDSAGASARVIASEAVEPVQHNSAIGEETPFSKGAALHESPSTVPADAGIEVSDHNVSPHNTQVNEDEQTQLATEAKQKYPEISLKDLQIWILKKKHTQDHLVRLEHKDEIMYELGLRDHVFLMDDASNMKKHWRAKEGDNIVDLAKALAYIVKESDDDGMELYFTCTGDKRKVNTATEMENQLRSKSMTINTASTSNMAASLKRITEEYAERLRLERNATGKRQSIFKRPKKLKPLSIYVFTDAVWQPHCDVGQVIDNLVRTMQDLNFDQTQVGIQFIQFGDDATCTKKLEDLDKAGKSKGYDIVDTEPAAGGNCWKMLLGAINKWYDDD